MLIEFSGAHSSVGEHYVDIVGVAGSIPAAPTISLKHLADSHKLMGSHLGHSWDSEIENGRY